MNHIKTKYPAFGCNKENMVDLEEDVCTKKNQCIGGCVFLLVAIVSIGIGAGFVYVPLERWGLLVNAYSKEVDPKALPSGAYGVYWAHQIYDFPRSIEVINFTEPYTGSGDDRVLRLTASDSATVELAMSFSYQLEPEHLHTLYKVFGMNWKTSIQGNSRSMLRDEGAKFAALDYVQEGERIQVEKAMKARMETYFKSEFVAGVPAAKLIGFYLLGVEFQKTAKRDKDQDILNAIKAIKDQEKITEQSKLGVIDEITKTNVSKLETERNSFVEVTTIDNANVQKTKEIELVQITAETARLVSEIATDAEANASNYRSATVNLKEAILTDVVAYEQESAALSNKITAETRLLKAENDAKIKEIIAEAQKDASVIIAAAEQAAYLNRTKAIETAYKNLKTQLALNGEDINILKFIRGVEMHKEEKLYMDLQKPNALNLPGQNEKYLESLKTGYTRL